VAASKLSCSLVILLDLIVGAPPEILENPVLHHKFSPR
jgi:hypothetical protein